MSTPFATNPGLVASQAASRQFPPRRTSLFGGGGGASTEPSPAVQEPFGGNLARDPFLTQMLSQDRPTNQRVLPQRPLMQDVGRDPFMTAAGQAQGQAWDFKANLRSEIQQGSKAIRRLLGPGDPDRTVLSRNILVAAPFLIFVWVLSMWCHLRHYSPEACVGLTIVLAVGSVSLLLQGYTGKSNSSVPLLPLGCLCLLAVSGGLFFGLQGWDYHWRQIWWSHTGSTSVARTASTPASSQLDAALIDFWESEATFLRRNDTSVDPTRGAGYKDQHFYCVAPIMSPQTAGTAMGLVNFWAIGVDCCQTLGSFTCDASRDVAGGYGMVMLDGGMPCPGCNVDQFQLAVKKAEAEHKLVSAQGALFLRWTDKPREMRLHMLLLGLHYMWLSIVCGSLILVTLSGFAWYYGIGTQRSAESEGSLHDNARLQSEVVK
mmetsp:Transcript_8735/g.13870  ORF Transcript_8735/g.13870 Transcript_8735/m.13870 type:complete len:432 (+) Transcript_8735:175-1470(+)